MLFIVSTQIKEGKGGISTALVGYIESTPLNNFGYKIVPSHSADKTHGTFSTAKRTLKSRVKKGDIVWLHCGPWFSMLRKWFLARTAKRKGAKVLLHFHSPTLEKYLKLSLGRFFIRLMLRDADGVVVLTPWWRKLFEAHIKDLSCPIVELGNPLEQMFEQLAGEPVSPCENENVFILTMARLVPDKGIADVIQALTKLPSNYMLSIAGSGPQLPELEQLVDRLKLSNRVQFLGWLNSEKKIEALKNASIFCLPSRYDSFGMVFTEAMAAGLPVVALRQGAVPEVVIDKKTGILVDDVLPETIAAAIREALKNRELFSSQGKEHVLQNFSKNQIAEKFVSFCRALEVKS